MGLKFNLLKGACRHIIGGHWQAAGRAFLTVIGQSFFGGRLPEKPSWTPDAIGVWRAAAPAITGRVKAKEAFAIGAGGHCAAQPDDTYGQPYDLSHYYRSLIALSPPIGKGRLPSPRQAPAASVVVGNGLEL